MKTKLYLSLSALFIVHFAAMANDPTENYPTQYRVLKQFTKWFTSVNVGAQFYIGDHDRQESLGKRLTPNYEISVGKWVNQSFGVRGGINGCKAKGLAKQGKFAISKEMVIGSPHFLYDQEFNFLNLNVDLLFHWSNDAYDLDLKRLYNIIPYGGMGMITAINKQKKTNLTMHLGVIQTLRLSNYWDLNLDVKGTLIPDSFDGEKGGRSYEGKGVATLGITYNFR